MLLRCLARSKDGTHWKLAGNEIEDR